jgi:hypothetical protein
MSKRTYFVPTEFDDDEVERWIRWAEEVLDDPDSDPAMIEEAHGIIAFMNPEEEDDAEDEP